MVMYLKIELASRVCVCVCCLFTPCKLVQFKDNIWPTRWDAFLVYFGHQLDGENGTL